MHPFFKGYPLEGNPCISQSLNLILSHSLKPKSINQTDSKAIQLPCNVRSSVGNGGCLLSPFTIPAVQIRSGWKLIRVGLALSALPICKYQLPSFTQFWAIRVGTLSSLNRSQFNEFGSDQVETKIGEKLETIPFERYLARVDWFTICRVIAMLSLLAFEFS